MKKETEGVLVREGDRLYVKTKNGKNKLLYNLFDGMAGKKIKLTIKEVK